MGTARGAIENTYIAAITDIILFLLRLNSDIYIVYSKFPKKVL